MQHAGEDYILARVLESEMALAPAAPYLNLPISDLIPGARSQAEAFIANAPSLYGYERDTERIFMVLDLAVSAVQADPTYGGGYALAAACVYRLGVIDVDIYDPRALDAALPWAARAREMDPVFENGWEVFIELLCFKGDFTTAEKALGEVYQRFGDNDLYARTAFLYFRLQGDTAQALNWGALAWQTEWDEVRLVHTLFALGQLYRDVGEWRKAADAYRVITERDRENAWAWHYAARCSAELGDFNTALEQNKAAINLGGLHDFRAYQEELRRAQGRARMGSGRVTASPPSRVDSARVVAAPPPAKPSKVVSAPPPAKPSTVVAPPPPAKPSSRVVKAPPPAGKVVKSPPAVSPPKRPVRPPRKPPVN